ncbi:hypothetical protein PVAND_013267 [Polypedilum vanderplanki]|uniref:Uncharacterized protein n=1 Tax=Polypedilum vanderplanki TaxID=319348 RepID=A0A9J6CQX3_POLVA|nr:hypothetical protein PVAND_013267 [Polypedilum vanderplanki]
MKILIVLAAVVCVAHCTFKEATTTKDVFNQVWEKNGARIVTFGYARCPKAVRSREQIKNFIDNSKVCSDVDYVFADCMKAASGTCKGLFDNYMDYLPLDQKFSFKMKYPRTFFFHKEGNKAAVVPISETGRMHESHLGDQARFDDWCASAKAEANKVHGWT